MQEQLNSAVLGSSNATIGAYPITASGTDSYTGTFTDLSYFTGFFINLLATNTNTGAATFNLNGLGAKDIKVPTRQGLRDARAGELVGQIQMVYDGTQFILTDMGATQGLSKINDSFHADPVSYYGNVKTIDDGQGVGEWKSISNATVEVDSTNVKIGSTSIRVSGLTQSLVMGGVENISLDLSKTNNGEIAPKTTIYTLPSTLAI